MPRTDVFAHAHTRVCDVVQLATMRVAAEQKEKAAVARRLKNRFGDDADDLSRRMLGSGKHDKIDLKAKSADQKDAKGGKNKAGGKFDPYNPKSGTLPELNVCP